MSASQYTFPCMLHIYTVMAKMA